MRDLRKMVYNKLFSPSVHSHPAVCPGLKVNGNGVLKQKGYSMSEDNGYKDAFNFHRATQNKFEYFFLGVILASLSLSVQTFNPAIENQQVILIYISWLF